MSGTRVSAATTVYCHAVRADVARAEVVAGGEVPASVNVTADLRALVASVQREQMSGGDGKKVEDSRREVLGSGDAIAGVVRYDGVVARAHHSGDGWQNDISQRGKGSAMHH